MKRESAVMPQGPALVKAGSSIVGGIKVSHPERIIDASTGITKLELVRYYESVADWMLPHLKGRPCSLVRGPTGVGGELFFQKHIESLQITGIQELDAALWPGHAPLLEVPTAKALIGAAQMNVIEFHTWNALAKKIDQPDRVIFDLDPGEGERWERVQEAATLVRGLLQELGLQSWLKTSGGKGLHVVVPLTPRDDWDTVKAFAQAVGAAPGAGDPAALRGQDGRGQPRRQDLRRLPAQQPRRDDRGRVLGALAARARRVDADRLGRPGRAEAQRPVDACARRASTCRSSRSTRGRTTGAAGRR